MKKANLKVVSLVGGVNEECAQAEGKHAVLPTMEPYWNVQLAPNTCMPAGSTGPSDTTKLSWGTPLLIVDLPEVFKKDHVSMWNPNVVVPDKGEAQGLSKDNG